MFKKLQDLSSDLLPSNERHAMQELFCAICYSFFLVCRPYQVHAQLDNYKTLPIYLKKYKQDPGHLVESTVLWVSTVSTEDPLHLNPKRLVLFYGILEKLYLKIKFKEHYSHLKKRYYVISICEKAPHISFAPLG